MKRGTIGTEEVFRNMSGGLLSIEYPKYKPSNNVFTPIEYVSITDPFAAQVLFYVNTDNGVDDTGPTAITGAIQGSGSLVAAPYAGYTQSYSTLKAVANSCDYTGFTPITLSTQDFTWEMLVYHTTTPGGSMATGSFASNVTTSAWGISPFGSPIYFVRNGSALLNTSVTPASLPVSQLVHWAVVNDAGTVSVYLDGVQVGTNPAFPDTMTTLDAFYMGRHNGYSVTEPPEYIQIMRYTEAVRYTANFDPVNDTVFPLSY